MFSKILSVTALALAASGLVSAQTFSTCNPVKGDKCPADEAVGGTVDVDFTKGPSDFFTIAEGTNLTYDPTNGAIFKITKDGDAPTITSKKYILFGSVSVHVKASFGTGIVTSLVLQSDCLDEIDWEWLGGDTTQVQTNYFRKGDTSTYDRGGYSPVANPQTEWHKYTIDWTSTALTWSIDDKPVRVLAYADAKGGANYPQTPMQIKLGTWVAGRKDAPEGTVQWAGGYTNFADAPFIGYYKDLQVVDYSNGVKGATSYVYGDTSGTYGSIIVKTDGSTSSNSSSNASSSGTKSSSSTSTTLSTVSATQSSNATVTGSTSTSTSTGAGSAGSANAASSSSSTSATATSKNAAGKVTLTVGNVILVGAAVFMGSLIL